MVQTKK